MKLRLPFRHHELFYYNKKLFIHYFLVPGRQVPFLVRGAATPAPIGRSPMVDIKNKFLNPIWMSGLIQKILFQSLA